MHILILTDRDWEHPQGGGTGTNLLGQIAYWRRWGHRVTVIACGFPGCEERADFDGVTVHRIGGRSTVFPRTILRQRAGFVPDADVVLEVINGITFLTPLWLKTPRVALIHHIHRRHYSEEMGLRGRIACLALETLPLRFLYRKAPFLTVSESSAREMEELGIDAQRINVNYNGIDTDWYWPGEKASRPTILYLGRLKRYKHIERLLAAVVALPGVYLEIAGDGDQREVIEEQVRKLGIEEWVTLHGFVDEERKRELLQAAWVNATASVAEGWGLSVMEAAACGTPSVALAHGGLTESIRDGESGLLARDPEELVGKLESVLTDARLRARLEEGALAYAASCTWERTARVSLDALAEVAGSAVVSDGLEDAGEDGFQLAPAEVAVGAPEAD